MVALLQGGVRRGDRHAPLAPEAGDDEPVVAVEGDVADAFAENRRIGGAEFGDKDIFRVVGVGRGKIRGTDDKPPEQGDGQDLSLIHISMSMCMIFRCGMTGLRDHSAKIMTKCFVTR